MTDAVRQTTPPANITIENCRIVPSAQARLAAAEAVCRAAYDLSEMCVEVGADVSLPVPGEVVPHDALAKLDRALVAWRQMADMETANVE